MEVGNTFGERLRRSRERATLTQEELAKRAGLTAMAISALERGERRRPYPKTVRALADALGLDETEREELAASVQRRSDQPSAVVRAIRSDWTAASLPPEPTALLGRDEELAVLRDQLVSPEVRLLTLVGPGGVGKPAWPRQLPVGSPNTLFSPTVCALSICRQRVIRRRCCRPSREAFEHRTHPARGKSTLSRSSSANDVNSWSWITLSKCSQPRRT